MYPTQSWIHFFKNRKNDELWRFKINNEIFFGWKAGNPMVLMKWSWWENPFHISGRKCWDFVAVTWCHHLGSATFKGKCGHQKQHSLTVLTLCGVVLGWWSLWFQREGLLDSSGENCLNFWKLELRSKELPLEQQYIFILSLLYNVNNVSYAILLLYRLY